MLFSIHVQAFYWNHQTPLKGSKNFKEWSCLAISLCCKCLVTLNLHYGLLKYKAQFNNPQQTVEGHLNPGLFNPKLQARTFQQ